MSAKSELIQKFKTAAEATTASVEIITYTPEQISIALKAQIDPGNKVLVSSAGILLPEDFLKSITPIYRPDNNEIANTPFAITEAFCGIAETGSIIIPVDRGYAAYFGMLSIKHIAVLKAADIYQKPRDLFNIQNPGMKDKKTYSIITGPSATADMGSLVRGVHGPEYLHLIILDEQ